MATPEKGDFLEFQSQQKEPVASLTAELLTNPAETVQTSSSLTAQNALQPVQLFDSTKNLVDAPLSDASQFCDVREGGPSGRQTAEGGRIQDLVEGPGGLGSSSYAQIRAAESEILRQGIGVLPHLIHGMDTLQGEHSQRCGQLIPRLLRQPGVSTDSLLNARDLRRMENMFQAALGRSPSKAESADFAKVIEDAVAERIRQPQAERNVVRFMAGSSNRPQADAAMVQALDNLDSEQGRRQLNDRLVRLVGINGHANLTGREQESIARQLTDMGTLMSPSRVHEHRINARLDCGRSMSGTAQEIQNFMLDTVRACRGGNEAARAAQLICDRNLDRDPQFMQAYRAAGFDQQPIDQARERQMERMKQQGQQQSQQGPDGYKIFIIHQ